MMQGRHIELVEAVNNATTEREHREAECRLDGYRDALKIIHGDRVGNLLMQCDQHYLSQGVERDMCCGVFLDWKPTRS
jgi:hypothetical protein